MDRNVNQHKCVISILEFFILQQIFSFGRTCQLLLRQSSPDYMNSKSINFITRKKKAPNVSQGQQLNDFKQFANGDMQSIQEHRKN